LTTQAISEKKQAIMTNKPFQKKPETLLDEVIACPTYLCHFSAIDG